MTDTIRTGVVLFQIANLISLEVLMTTSFRLTPSMHMRRPQDFELAYKTGERAGDAHLLVFAFVNRLPQTRVGLSVSKKHGSAVRRNLKRRRLKEAFRLLKHEEEDRGHTTCSHICIGSLRWLRSPG